MSWYQVSKDSGTWEYFGNHAYISYQLMRTKQCTEVIEDQSVCVCVCVFHPINTKLNVYRIWLSCCRLDFPKADTGRTVQGARCSLGINTWCRKERKQDSTERVMQGTSEPSSPVCVWLGLKHLGPSTPQSLGERAPQVGVWGDCILNRPWKRSLEVFSGLQSLQWRCESFLEGWIVCVCVCVCLFVFLGLHPQQWRFPG